MSDRDPNHRIAEQARARDALTPILTAPMAPSWGDGGRYTATWYGYFDWATWQRHADPILSDDSPFENDEPRGTAKLTPTDTDTLIPGVGDCAGVDDGGWLEVIGG